MAADPRLRSVALFAGLDDEDLDRICVGTEEVQLQAGEVLFNEGETGDTAYVVTDGEVEILKATPRRDIRLAVRGDGEVIGEIGLLYQETRSATVRAIGATTLLAIPKAVLDELLNTSPTAARTMFHTLGARLRENYQETKQSEQMVQLGTLAVGVAHELNNPAAGVQRAAQQLTEQLDGYRDAVAAIDPTVAAGVAVIDALVARLSERRTATASLSALDRSDLEDDLADWLQAAGIAEAWSYAPVLADAGVRVDDLDALTAAGAATAAPMDGVAMARRVRLLVSATQLNALSASIVEGASRISAIVGALKRHNVTDQAPLVQVDVIRGIEDTLLLIGHKVKLVAVVREYAPDLPMLTGFGSDLNQVWTNLIDNACDAMLDVGTADPTLTIRAWQDDSTVLVEVADNGPGVPAELQDRIFDAFFTTKPPGRGTGLGLQISARIVLEHDGDLRVTSQPGDTVFRVTLPTT